MLSAAAARRVRRVVHAGLLVAALLLFLPHPIAPLAVWLGTAGALVLAMRDPRLRPSAGYAFAALVVVVVLTIAGAGATVSGVAIVPDETLEIFLLAVIATVWVPAGVFVATDDTGAPRRLARVGLAFLAGWFVLFALLVASGSQGEAHILLAAVGALLIAAALVWRILRPDERVAVATKGVSLAR